ncbi:MAG: hypothetical protein P4M01_11185 [Acidobacteriota bacterium]|nr:hypothetical protein [Acidobacteriota bacterium]
MPQAEDNSKTLPAPLPEFTSEAEEARWWFEHQDQLAERFQKAAAAGALSRGTIARRSAPEPNS